MSWNTPEFKVSMLDAYMDAMRDGRAPHIIDQIRGEIEAIQQQAVVEQDRHESFAMQWGGVGFRASQILRQEIQQQAVVEQDRHESLAMQWGGVGFRASQILRQEIPVFREAAVHFVPTTWDELLPRITNTHQVETLQRLTYRSEARQIFLSGFRAEDERSELEGTFTVLGTRNRQGLRESYQVKWYRQPTARGSFWCNCPDHKFNSTKKHIVCKHICFLVCRVARFMDPVFFETHRLTNEQHSLFLRIVRENTIFSDQSVVHPLPSQAASIQSSVFTEQKRAPFMECRKSIEPEDSCPICYNELTTSPCLSCPTCSNNIHRECMEVWLERKNTCVYCRSNVWAEWN